MSKNKNFDKKSLYDGSNSYFPNKPFQIFYEDDSDADWLEFRKELLAANNKSQDDFENRLTLLSSGGLIISLTFLDKLFEYQVDVTVKVLLITAIVLYISSLMANLYSHVVAIKNNEKTIEDVDMRNADIVNNIVRRNKPIRILNNISSLAISFATIFLFLFFVINYLNMSNKDQQPKEKPKTSQSNPKPLNEEKGRIISNPSFSVKPKK